MSISYLILFFCIFLSTRANKNYCSMQKYCNGKKHVGCMTENFYQNSFDLIFSDPKDILNQINRLRNNFVESKQIANMRMVSWNVELENLSKAIVATTLPEQSNEICFATGDNHDPVYFASPILNVIENMDFVNDIFLNLLHQNEALTTSLIIYNSNALSCGCSIGKFNKDRQLLTYMVCLFDKSEESWEEGRLIGKPCTKCVNSKCSNKQYSGLCVPYDTIISSQDDPTNSTVITKQYALSRFEKVAFYSLILLLIILIILLIGFMNYLRQYNNFYLRNKTSN